MRAREVVLAALVLALLGGAGLIGAFAEGDRDPNEPLPTITVADQTIANGVVEVEQVLSDRDGWLVICNQAKDGKAGQPVGYVAVEKGQNWFLTVNVDVAKVTGTLWAMLQKDLGEVGKLEYPSPDVTVEVNDEPLAVSFQASR